MLIMSGISKYRGASMQNNKWNTTVQGFVSVLDGEKLPSFLGSMLARRRAAAAEVAKQDMKHPDTKRNLLSEFC